MELESGGNWQEIKQENVEWGGGRGAHRVQREHNVGRWRKRNFANLMTNKYDYTESASCSVFVT